MSDKISIYDAEGSKLYTDCWNYGDSVRENYAPLGAANLLQVVNERPELNGKLMVIYDHLASVLTSINDKYSRYKRVGTPGRGKHKLYLFIYRSGYKKSYDK